MNAVGRSDAGPSYVRRAIHEPLPPHVLMLVGRENARNHTVADRLRREAGVTVEIVQADLDNAVDIRLVDSRLDRDGRIGVLVNNAGVTFMVAFPSRGSTHAR